MSNNIYIATDLAATNALITTVDTVVDAIRAVDVPALSAEHVAIDADVAAVGVIVADVHDVDLPAQNLGVIKLMGSTINSAYQELLNYTGIGILHEVEFKLLNPGAGGIRITIDGGTPIPLNIAAVEVRRVVRQGNTGGTFPLTTIVSGDEQHIDLQFNTSLLIEMKGDDSEDIWVGVLYSV